ncbi:MAG TPA: glycosyltransferase [Longimicrobiales bacterium]|nr:glycosyltransferase [Longimicrobiales bacterium]
MTSSNGTGDIASEPAGAPRIAVFTHDTFGMGHVRRSLRIMGGLARQAPGSALLLVTGSPALGAFGGLPQNADVVKIPTVVKTGSRSNRPPHLPISQHEVTGLRRDLIRAAITGFAPDVFLVDNFPLGSQGELLPTLHAMKARGTRTVLGLRDVMDAPDVVQADWDRQGMYDILHRYYDRILVYGMEAVLDVRTAYRLPAPVAERVRYCGYVTENDGASRPAGEVRAEIGLDGPLVIVTGGGGGDAYPLLKLSIEALRDVPDAAALVITGPLMQPAEREKLRALGNGRERLRIVDSVSDMPSYLAAADAVVSMCGYNTLAEIVAVGARAVVVPRTWRYGEHLKRGRSGVEWEQLLRAQALSRLGYVDLIEPEAADAERLSVAIRGSLERSRPSPAEALDLGGAERAAHHILELVAEERRCP